MAFLETTRAELGEISRRSPSGLISVKSAASAWGEPTRVASLRLAKYARAGWLVRARRGLYFIPPLESGPQPTVGDPLVLASVLFDPCYIGGWTAAEHWGLTEQIFRSTFVVSAAAIRKRQQTILGAEFRCVRVSESRVTSVGSVWRGTARVRLASAEHTLADAFVEPNWVGGVRHLVQILDAYREVSEGDSSRLLKELEATGRGSAFKRVGFLAEKLWPEARDLIALAERRRSTGVIRLDPAIKRRGRMSRRWGLWLNVEVDDRAQS